MKSMERSTMDGLLLTSFAEDFEEKDGPMGFGVVPKGPYEIWATPARVAVKAAQIYSLEEKTNLLAAIEAAWEQHLKYKDQFSGNRVKK